MVRRAGEIPSPFTSELIFQFTAAHLYEWDEPKRSDRRPAARSSTRTCSSPCCAAAAWTTGSSQSDRPGRESAPAPRPAAAHRGRDGRASAASGRSDPLGAFRPDGGIPDRAARWRVEPSSIELPGTSEPFTVDLGRGGIALSSRRSQSRSLRDDEARAAIVRRFLHTHALIGLADLTARYPIPPVEAADLLERWSEEGKVVRVGDPDSPELERWAERENLAEMRRVTVAVRRRESLAVAPEVFADFLLRRQHVHPATRGEGPAFVERVLEQLQGFAAPAAVWEKEILPRRVKGYRPAWLDDVLGQGAWLWRAVGTIA